ncbi:uncharacterized protein EDB91DRAFT_1241276 [Suillus paluster]|uniref:uncharacterized protein n=1 Tax=Suillus paluster TaxID=48578 RepID=UPI001B871237|nr:uncharacterized protein EDB91DRAFT_1241276 [Suillus paluster]KAG1756178.1 hypothetical protein EDB91DRAFT_1241276 [Suillus paluster]
MSSEDSKSPIHITKLTSSNYPTWKGEMKAYLRTKGLWLLVSGTEKRPADTQADAQAKWDVKADKAAGELYLACSVQQRMHIDAVQDDPVSIWSTLASIHVQQRPGARFNAWDDFFSIRKQPDEPLSTLIARIGEGMSKIQELRPKDTSKPYSITDLDAELVCMTMVRSLGEEYNHFASSLMLLKSLDKEELKSAFLAEELQRKRRPEGPTGDSALFTSSGESLPPGTEHQKAPAMMKDLLERWKDMLKDEREAIMEDALAALHALTGMEIIMLAVHSDVDHFNQPHVFHTKRARDFFTACLKSSVHDIAFRLEGFCVAGVKGLARTHIKEVIQLKRQISELVLQKLQTVAAPQKVSRMYYQNFNTNITAQYHIIIENWPLAKFCAPGDISSCNKLGGSFQAALALQNEATMEGTQNKATVEGTQNEAAMEGTQPSSPKHPLKSSPVTTDTAHPNNTDLQTQPQPDANPRPSGSSQPRGCKHKAPSTEVLNTVFSSNGDGVPVQKKVWKERSDKGKACGPWKKVPADVPQESEVPPASAERLLCQGPSYFALAA